MNDRKIERRRNPGAPRWILAVQNFLADWASMANRFYRRGKK